jgi:MOSC domain-containing protein YiiM
MALPELLQHHFPQHGPYLGVYARVIRSGTVHVGDQLVVETQDEQIKRQQQKCLSLPAPELTHAGEDAASLATGVAAVAVLLVAVLIVYRHGKHS